MDKHATLPSENDPASSSSTRDNDDMASMSTSTSTCLLNSINSANAARGRGGSSAAKLFFGGFSVPDLQDLPIESALTTTSDDESDKYRPLQRSISEKSNDENRVLSSFSFYSASASSFASSLGTGVAMPPKSMLSSSVQDATDSESDGVSVKDLFDLIDEGDWARVSQHVQSHPQIYCRTPHAATGSLLLHHACKNKPPQDFIQFILDIYPVAASRPDNWGYLPVHYGCTSGATPDVLRCVLEAYPPAAQHAVDRRRLPLHLACQWGATPQAMTAILEYSPFAVDQGDSQGNSPIDYIEKHILTEEGRADARVALAQASQFQRVAEAAKTCNAVDVKAQLQAKLQAELVTHRRGDKLRQQSLQRALALQSRRLAALEESLAQARRESAKWQAAWEELQLESAFDAAAITATSTISTQTTEIASVSNLEAEVTPIMKADAPKECPNNESMDTVSTVNDDEDDEESDSHNSHGNSSNGNSDIDSSGKHYNDADEIEVATNEISPSHDDDCDNDEKSYGDDSQQQQQEDDVVVDISLFTKTSSSGSSFYKDDTAYMATDSSSLGGTQPTDNDHSNSSSSYSEDFYSDDHPFERHRDILSPVLAALDEVSVLDPIERQRVVDL